MVNKDVSLQNVEDFDYNQFKQSAFSKQRDSVMSEY